MSAEAVASDAQLARRVEAIEVSGWGGRFKFFQPHNLCFWVYLVIVAIGLAYIVQTVGGQAGFYGPSYITAAILFGFYGLIIFIVLRLADRYERQPFALAFTGMVWGAVAATFAIAIHGNDANIALLAKLFGQPFSVDWGAAISAPFVEETSKAAGFILLMGMAPRLIRSVYDGLFIGAFIGLGFEILEDVIYGITGSVAQFGTDQFQAVLGIFALRGITGLASHALYTAVFCAGLVYLIGTPAQPRRTGTGLLLMLAAILAHGIWDAASGFGDGGPGALLAMVGSVLIGWGALIVVLRRSAGQERDWMRAILDPEVSNGTITQEELDALVARRKQRKRFIRAGKGHRSHKQAKHVLAAAGDLAEELALAGGGESPEVDRARAEVGRLRAA